MIQFRRLPALLKLAAVIGVLAPVLALAILLLHVADAAGYALTLPISLHTLEPNRSIVAVGGLILLGVGCALPVAWYASRFRQPADRQTHLDTARSQIGALVLLTALPVTLLVLVVLAPADFPLLTVGLGLDVAEFALIIGTVIYVELQSHRASLPGDSQGQTGGEQTSEQERTHSDQAAGGIPLGTAAGDQLPFQQAWWAFDLGRYRPCDGTYCYYPIDSLPPLQQPARTLDWLGPLDERTDRQMEIHRNAPEERGALQTIQAEAANLRLTLPAAFLELMGSSELQDRIPSCTACFFKLSEHIVPCIGTENGYLIRFLNDQQDVLLWFLFLTPSGDERVLVSGVPLDELASEYPQGPTDDQRKAIIANTYVCAPSFAAFIYRWWLENTIWFKLDTSDGGKLTDEEQRYLAHYEQHQGVNAAN